MTAAKALPASTRAHFASSSPRPLAGQAATCQLAGVDVRLVVPSEGQGERVAEPNLLFSPEFLREGRAPPRSQSAPKPSLATNPPHLYSLPTFEQR